jgi:hypothetical protein
MVGKHVKITLIPFCSTMGEHNGLDRGRVVFDEDGVVD